MVGKRWAWSPFVVALLMACVWIVANAWVLRVVTAQHHLTDEQWQRISLRARVLIPSLLSFGICFGLVAGSIPSYWPDALFGSLLLLFGVAPQVILLIWMKRRRSRHEVRPPAIDE
jgi:hypothetical protein